MSKETRIYGSQSGQPSHDIKKSTASPTSGGAHRWQVRYDEMKLGKKLGNGAYGEVYEGVYKKGKVAVKVYDFRGALTVDQQGEIVKEADLMESLRSEYLVGFRGICLDQRYCLVMEYCEGGTLRARLNQIERDISLVEQLHWAKQISYGLYQLHSVRIVHRDLKGENILLDKHNDAKVADFGLSLVKTSSASQSKKSGGAGAVGTLPWMAPELFEDKPNSAATDVYSLGVVLWEIVSRQIPFARKTPAVIVGMALAGKRETLPIDCHKVFQLMIQACWDSDPAKRPTAEKVGDEFAALLESLESIPASVSSPASLKSSLEKEKKQESGRAAVIQSEEMLLAQFGVPTAPVQTAKMPTEDELLKLRDEVAALKLRQAEEEQRRVELQKQQEENARLRAELDRRKELEQPQEIQRREVEKKKTPPSAEPKKPLEPSTATPLSQNPYTLSAPKPAVKPVLDQKAVEKLLRLVAEGEQDQAEKMLKKDKNLLLSAGTVTDLSGREFKQITAFQYALWALDWHMWTMIQKYLPAEVQAEQLNALESKGTAHGKHFNFTQLTTALQTYVDNAEKVWKYDQRAENYWQKEVGCAQRLLPVHAINEYCRPDRSFDPCPQFTEERLPRTRAFYDKSDWFKAQYNGGLLGQKFAVARGAAAAVCRGGGLLGGWDLRGGVYLAGVLYVDLQAVQSLSKTRTQQLDLLASQLKSSSSLGMKV